MVKIIKINNVFVKILCDEESIEREIIDAFSFKVDYFIPKQYWDFYMRRGMKKCLYNKMYKTFYIGLLPFLVKFLQEKDYEYHIEGNFTNANSFSEAEALEFIKTLPLPFEVRDYQLKYFIKAIRTQRMICLSPTSSGKSLLIYLIVKYLNKRSLIIIPSTTLILQLKRDFISFGCSEEDIHTIFGGETQETNAKFVISTWQGLQYSTKKEWFDQFEVVIGDEVHHFSSDKTVKIMTMIDAPIRIGMTGSMKGKKLSDYQVQGLFGPLTQYISTKELIEKKFVSDLLIKAVVLHHVTGLAWKGVWSPDYEIERDNLLSNKKRNDFLVNLALSQKGNTFVMFERIEHGKILYEKIKKKATCPVYFVSGAMKVEDRDNIIQTLSQLTESISVVSRVFATGVSIPSLNNIIFTHPSKSRVKVLQSIGRSLRLHKNKIRAIVIDVVDNLIENPKIKNTTYIHFLERMKIYKKEGFEVKKYDVNLK